MSHESTSVTTYQCDAFNCGSVLTLGGEHPEIAAEEKGWFIVILDKELDLCPKCTNTIWDFFYGEDKK